MRDSLTVFWKEVLETFGNRHSFRGALFQGLLVIAITGVMVPAMQPEVLGTVGPAAFLYVVFPATLAATVASDSFAGERERKTIDTLMSTPLTDMPIFVGKAATAVLFVTVVAMVALAVACITAFAQGFSAEMAQPIMFAGVIAGAVAGSLVTAAFAIAISVRLPVARAVQQMASILTFILAAVVVVVFDRLGLPINWRTILRADAAVFVVGVVALGVAKQLFRRDRLFENRG